MTEETNNQGDRNSALDEWLSRKKKSSAVKGIQPMPDHEAQVLSHGQQRLWLLDKLYPNSPLYSYAHRYQIQGSIDLDQLVESFQVLAQRHEVIRANYSQNDDNVVQNLNHEDLTVLVEDLSDLAIDKQKEKLHLLRQQYISEPFDLSIDPLFRVYITKLGEDRHEVLLVLHHIIGDAWSMGVINTELSAIYQLKLNPETHSLEPLSVQYKDFAFWQHNQKVKEEDLTYWKQQLSGQLPVLNLPKSSKKSLGNFSGNTHIKLLPSTLANDLKTLSHTLNTTMYVLMVAAYKVLLNKYCRQTDILVGSPVSNRDTKELEKLVGFFNETVVLRTDLSGDPTFSELVATVKRNTLDALAHKNVPFDTLVNEINPQRQTGGNPFFQTMFLYNGLKKPLFLGQEVEVLEEMLDLKVSKFDLTLFVNELPESLELKLEHSIDFEEEFIASMADHFETLLKSLVINPNQRLSEVSLFSEEGLRDLEKLWFGPKVPLAKVNSIQSLIVDQVNRQPDAKAVIFGNDVLTYAELDLWSDQIADVLTQKAVQRNSFVGLYTDRSLEMVVGILGILKAGGAYLPLDPDYPEERIDFMLSDAQVSIVLSQPEIQERLAVDSDKIVTLQPYDEKVKSEKLTAEYDRTDDFAYVIYTSGSTGKPKGVPVTHGNLIHSTAARFEFYKDEMSSFLLLSSFSFDSSIVGIFWSLCSGGTLVLPPKRIEQDVATLSELIDKHQVSHTLMLPSLYQVLLSFAAPIKLRSLKAVIVAGEACSLSMRNDHFYTLPDTKLYNEYGPTEASVWCIAHEIKREDAAATVPIGRPIPNTSSLILDEGLNPVPLGVAGELYIGGSGITNGYLNRGDLTNERFIENPFDKKTTLYRTGDLAKFGIDGVIEFLGRVDQQIKIRGFRVELEEIKNVILQEDGITEAVVDAVEVESGTKKIIAWVQSDVLEIGERVIRRLKKTLPEYMVPSNFEVLDVLPRLPNGKVDRKQLSVTKGGTIKKGAYTAPKDDKEKLLVALWSNVLGLEKVSTSDNFFDIGGDSIRSIEIVAKARQHNLRIGPTQLFEYQTIEALAGNVFFDQNSHKEADTPVIDYPLELPLTYQQEAFLFHSLQGENDQGFLQLEFHISGEIDLSLMQKAWQRVVECHPIMRTSFYWGDAISQQIIHETAELPLQFVDFSDYNKVAQQDSIEKLKSEDKGQGLNLQEVPCARLTLINLGLDKHLLIWTSHHILIDGWSGAIILKDALSAYHGICLGNGSTIDSVPNYQQYFNWRSSKNNEAAKLFWQKMLQDANSPMFSDLAKSGPKPSAIYEDVTIHLEEAIGVTLQTIAQEQRLTVNTVLQGLWMITLRNYFANNDITLGLTVSGRASDFDGIDRVTGLFMNVLPLRKQVVAQDLLVTWLGELQQVLNELKNFEYIETDEILSWLKEAEPRQNFDCLFVFGNFMKDRLEIGPLTVEDFTGGFSSTFPLTLRINPLANVEINCRYNTSIVDSESAEWLIKSYEGAIHDLTKTEFSKIKVEDLISERASDSALQGSGELNRALIEVSASFSGSRNEVQLELSKIWEHVLGVDLIDIHDNYFELGGTSLGALRLFSLIEQRLERKLSPTVLISRPTISELSELISEGAGDQEWSSIIPMKTSGTEKPLFCIHSGGAHVLFYQGLARHMDQSRPVYAIQPSGIDGNESYHESIPIMAAHYINEMKKVQPDGPYHLLGTCFGNAVGLEMAHQLKKMGERLTALYIIDSAPAYLQPPSPNGERRPVARMLSMIKSGNWRGIVKKIKGRYIRLDKRITVDQRNEQQIELDEMIDSLNDLYTKYSWEPIDDNIVLIRSKEFSNRRDKTFHVEQWKKLALGNLETHEIEGHHLTLFDEPEVQGLAKALGTEMSKMESQFIN